MPTYMTFYIATCQCGASYSHNHRHKINQWSDVHIDKTHHNPNIDIRTHTLKLTG